MGITYAARVFMVLGQVQFESVVELETSFWLFKYIVRKMTVICGSSYIARYDERIRVNGQNNDRCEADRE